VLLKQNLIACKTALPSEPCKMLILGDIAAAKCSMPIKFCAERRPTQHHYVNAVRCSVVELTAHTKNEWISCYKELP
jgi:hypothetical protein